MKSEDLLTTHSAYSNHANQADFFYRSYIGGELYQAGEYLIKYLGEQNTPGDSYAKRIAATPLDNHVKTTVDIYGSFLFRNLPKRTLGNLVMNPQVMNFVHDIDNNGTSFDTFMKQVNDMAMVLGNMWILVDKPDYAVTTQAEQEAMGIKAYCAAYTPQNVLDWHYRKTVAGKMELDYIKVIEFEDKHQMQVVEWKKDHIHKYTVQKDSDTGEYGDVIEQFDYLNPLGMIPFINYAPLPSATQGIGISLINDIAYAQKYIYNLLSELEQNIRISGHPSLVKTPSTQASAGAGAIITVQEDMEPGLKPYLLQPAGSSIDGILKSIDKVVQSIHRMTHTSAVQIMRGSPMSGTALQTERQLLSTKLVDISHVLHETEAKIWTLWFKWMNIDQPQDFSIEYAETFDIRDEHSDLELYKKAIDTVQNDEFKIEMMKMIADMLIEDETTRNQIHSTMSLQEKLVQESTQQAMADEQMPHPPMQNPADMISHIREMMDQGLTNEQILELHPEIQGYFTQSE
jgi:hypothetical protein